MLQINKITLLIFLLRYKDSIINLLNFLFFDYNQPIISLLVIISKIGFIGEAILHYRNIIIFNCYILELASLLSSFLTLFLDFSNNMITLLSYEFIL